MFSTVSLSVILFVGRFHVTTTHNAICQSQVTWDTPLPTEMFKPVTLGNPLAFKLVYYVAQTSVGK